MSNPNTLRIFALIHYFSGLTVSGGNVTGSVNDTLTLPCTFTDDEYPDFMCWGRGGCPQFACKDEIIWIFGRRLTWRKSDRYQLLGNITEGDVSLTITGATKEDEGPYCCRVKIPGSFHDLKKEIVMHILEPIENLEDRECNTDRSTEVMTVTDSVDSGEQDFPSIGNIIRGIIIVLFPPLFLLLYKYTVQ